MAAVQMTKYGDRNSEGDRLIRRDLRCPSHATPYMRQRSENAYMIRKHYIFTASVINGAVGGDQTNPIKIYAL